MGVYTLKELEKLLPSVGSINGMQVKEYVQALQDENQIRVEKIGSGNWYWSFKSDAKKTKEAVFNALKLEERKLMALIADTERQIEEEMAKRNEDDDMLGEDGMDRKTILEFHETLLKDMDTLDKELSLYSENDPAEVLRKVEDIQKFKNSAIRWTDNIESLESFIVSLVGDRVQAANVMQAACGDEYIVGEGLREL